MAAMSASGPEAASSRSRVIIEPTRGWAPLNVRELWEFREFLFFMVWRDLKVRYKQTVLGMSWAIIQPFAMMLIFTMVFAQLAGVQTTGPYPVFAYAALLPWGVFSRGLTDGGMSISRNANIVGKVYFPRLLLPVATIASALVDFAISLPILGILMLYYGVTPGWPLLALPAFTILAAISALAVSFLLAPIEVRYRDIRYIVPFVSQFWLFATPIAYPISLVPTSWQWLYSLNPMVGIVEGFQWSVLGGNLEFYSSMALSFLVMGLLLLVSLFYFRRMERVFADVI